MQTRLGGEQIGSETMTVQNVTAGRRRGRNSSQREKKKNRRTDGNTEIEMQIVEINTHLTHEIISSTPGICEVNLSVTVVLLKKKKKKREIKKKAPAS